MLFRSPYTNKHASDDLCQLSNIIPYDNSSYSIYILCFTATYFLFPQFLNNSVNYFLFTFFLLYILIDIYVKNHFGCTLYQSTIGDILSGTVLGLIMSSIFSGLGLNKAMTCLDGKCGIPKEQQMKCSVYKNGELVT